MADPYSKRLGANVASTAAAVTVATVPASKLWIVRDIVVTQTSGGSARARLVNPAIVGLVHVTAVLNQWDMVVASERHIVMNAGESLLGVAFTTTGAFAVCWQVYGYELDA